MTNRYLQIVLFTFALSSFIRADTPAPNEGGSTTFIEVQKDVKLEVVDWGGNGRPLIFLHGAGCTAHAFDHFAPKFKEHHRVYGITRRGAGASSAPTSSYSQERFGKDILAIIEALHLSATPVLVGHSIAGGEMSWVSTRYPEKVAGFIYLDAMSAPAYYSEWSNDPGKGPIDVVELREKLDRLIPGKGELHPKKLAREVIADLPRLQQNLTAWLEDLKDVPEPTEEQLHETPPHWREQCLGMQKYTALNGPILAIIPVPVGTEISQGAVATSNASGDEPVRNSLSQADALKRGVPSARVVQIPGASHFVFESHEADVIREMNLFLDALKK